MRLDLGEAWCYETLRRVRWPNGIARPFCGRGHVTTHSKSSRTPRRRYLCLGCRRTFTDLTGTPLARTNLSLGTWFTCLRLLGERYPTAELARRLGVKWETTAHMQRQLVVALVRPGLIRQLRGAIGEGALSVAGRAPAGAEE